MPVSVAEQILQALFQALDEIPDILVERNRDDEFPAAELPALNLLDGGMPAVDRSVHGIDAYVMRPAIEGFVAAKPAAAAATAAQDLLARVQQRLGQLSNPPFDGLAVSVDEGEMTPDLARGTPEEPQAGFALVLEIEFWTKPGDPYAVGP